MSGSIDHARGATIPERIAALGADAPGETEQARTAFETAMRSADEAIRALQAMGYQVEVRHPMQARQTMLDTRLNISIPGISI